MEEESEEVEEVKKALKKKIDSADMDLLLQIYNLLGAEDYGFNWC